MKIIMADNWGMNNSVEFASFDEAMASEAVAGWKADGQDPAFPGLLRVFLGNMKAEDIRHNTTRQMRSKVLGHYYAKQHPIYADLEHPVTMALVKVVYAEGEAPVNKDVVVYAKMGIHEDDDKVCDVDGDWKHEKVNRAMHAAMAKVYHACLAQMPIGVLPSGYFEVRRCHNDQVIKKGEFAFTPTVTFKE